MADDENSKLVLKLIICLVAAAAASATAAVVITVYHCITARYMRPPASRRSSPPQEMSMSNSVVELLPAHKYRKGADGLIRFDGGNCAICLSEFDDGDELRTLPECVHSFHMACIDMWLYSHSNCPTCRAGIGPLGLSSPSFMQLLHHSNNHNATPIDIL